MRGERCRHDAVTPCFRFVTMTLILIFSCYAMMLFDITRYAADDAAFDFCMMPLRAAASSRLTTSCQFRSHNIDAATIIVSTFQRRHVAVIDYFRCSQLPPFIRATTAPCTQPHAAIVTYAHGLCWC